MFESSAYQRNPDAIFKKDKYGNPIFNKDMFEFRRDKFGIIVVDPTMLEKPENFMIDYEEYCKC